jgi:hypothetical protein
MSWLVLSADLIGGVLGAIASLLLGFPLLAEVKDRRQWDGYAEFLRLHSQANPEASRSATQLEAERSLRDRMLDDRLGRHERFRGLALLGFSLLVAAFAFMALAAAVRILQ